MAKILSEFNSSLEKKETSRLYDSGKSSSSVTSSIHIGRKAGKLRRTNLENFSNKNYHVHYVSMKGRIEVATIIQRDISRRKDKNCDEAFTR
jgi:hypothetical protein